MKKTVTIALLFIFAFFAFSNVSAQEKKPAAQQQQPPQTQEKKITDAEFKAVMKKSDDKIKGQNYRLRKSSKTYKRADNSLVYFSNETTEYNQTGDSRSVVESGSAGGANTTLSEIIRIGQKSYNRINNGNWNVSGQSSATRTTQTSAPNSVEHIYKGKVEINNQTADLYESRYVSKTVKGGRDFVTTTIVKRWFDKDGALFRAEEEIETPNTVTRRVYEYDYSADISIEAPM